MTLRTVRAPATDLGFLLRKHPDRLLEFPLSFGVARHFYPEATAEGCTAALWVEVDPVGLVRGREDDFVLRPYVNDRPYVGSSLLSVAIGQVYRSAMAGSCPDRPELPGEAWPMEVELPAIACHGGAALLERLFGPLGYSVEAEAVGQAGPDGAAGPDGPGAPRLWRVRLRAVIAVSALLRHLYVLIPVLDDGKHYWVGKEESEKLLRHGEDWLAAHPERELIARRYLSHQRKLWRPALERLAAGEEGSSAQIEDRADAAGAAEQGMEAPIRLDAARREAIAAILAGEGAATVVDLGCGEGKLIQRLLQDRRVTSVIGVDVSLRALEIAERRLDLDGMGPRQRARVKLLQGSMIGRDRRLEGADAVCCVEVIEHLEPHAVPAFTRALLGAHRPRVAVVTTPNVEYNARFTDMPAGKFRHSDHRFEWSRAEFRAWAEAAAAARGYALELRSVGEEDPALGPPTQLALFRRIDAPAAPGAPSGSPA